MIKRILIRLLILVFIFISLLPITYSGYSYWDNGTVNASEEINIGNWTTYLLNYDFSQDTVQTLIDDGALSSNFSKWTVANNALTNSLTTLSVYIPFNASEYTITTSAALSVDSNGYYGVIFEADASNIRKANGYIVRLDKTFSDGAITLVKRSNGKDSSELWSVTNLDTSAIPAYSVDQTWWESTHNITLEVSLVDASTKSVTVYLDSVQLGSYNFTFTSYSPVYTGFDVYRTTVEFYSISVS